MPGHSVLVRLDEMRNGKISALVRKMQGEGKGIRPIAAAISRYYVPVSKTATHRFIRHLDERDGNSPETALAERDALTEVLEPKETSHAS